MSKTSGLAITSFVLGILAFLLMWVPILGQILAVLGVIFGIVALVNIKKNPALEGKVMAVVGVVLSGVALFALIILSLIGAIAYFGVLNPANLIPDRCTASSGISCSIGHVDGDKMSIDLLTYLGSSVLLDTSKMTSTFGCDASTVCPSTNLDCNQQTATINNGEAAVITFESCQFKKGRNNIDLSIVYLNQMNGLDQVATLNIIKNID